MRRRRALPPARPIMADAAGSGGREAAAAAAAADPAHDPSATPARDARAAAEAPAGKEGRGSKSGADHGEIDLSSAWRGTIQRGERTFWHGEASVAVNDIDGTKWLSVLATPEVELMLRRLARDSTGMAPIRMPCHSENARIVRMVAAEYPLRMKTRALWDEVFDEIAGEERRASEVMSLERIDPPSAVFTGELMPHQQEALDYMEKCGGRCLLADEMGLGKTVEALAYLAGRAEAYPVAVVAPLVAVTHWKREIERFLRVDGPCGGGRIDAGGGGDGGARTPVIEVIRAGRKPWTARPRMADFYLVNYDLIAKWAYALSAAGIRTIIFDEVQALRHTTSQRYAACRRLALSHTVRHRIALSGTPVYNRRAELHNISEVIRPGVLGSQGEFLRRWPTQADIGGFGGEGDEEKERERRRRAEKSRLDLAVMLRRRFMLRRLKSEVIDLPEKTRLHQEIGIDEGYYADKVGSLLKDISAECERIKAGVEKEDGGAAGASPLLADKKRAGLMELHGRLRNMCVSERQIAGVSKAGRVAKYVGSLLADYTDDKFVVFVHHKTVRDMLLAALDRFGTAVITGGQNARERQAEIDRFQTDPDCRVMVAGLRAGNVGISLSAAAYVVFAELDWSPSVHRQAEDRLHRIGQKNPVVCHYMIGTGTFDEDIAQSVIGKALDISGVMGETPGRVDTAAALEAIARRYGARAARMAGGRGRSYGSAGGPPDARTVSAHAGRILDGLEALAPKDSSGTGTVQE